MAISPQFPWGMINMNEQKNIYDVLLAYYPLFQLLLGGVCALSGFVVSKWWEERVKRNDFKKGILLNVNRRLSRFVLFYASSFPYEMGKDGFEKKFEQESYQFDEIKADMEILAGDKTYESFLECAKNAKMLAEEAYREIKSGNLVTQPEKLKSYNKYHESYYKWIQTVRNELKINIGK